MLKVSAYGSGFQSDELNTSQEVTGGNKGFSVQTECGIVNPAVACGLPLSWELTIWQILLQFRRLISGLMSCGF